MLHLHRRHFSVVKVQQLEKFEDFAASLNECQRMRKNLAAW
jgi:hypothetical protein